MTAPSTTDRQQAVIAAYQQQTTAMRDQLAAALVALWLSLPDYRNTSARYFAQQATLIVQASMAHMQTTTVAYISTLLGLSGASSTPPTYPSLDIASVRARVNATQVYERPFHLVWRELHAGRGLSDAIRSGQQRAVSLAQTDLQLAKTHTARAAFLGHAHIVGWRRVLEGPHSCALCGIAATARYHSDELMPIHPGCDCSVAPIVGEDDPGHVIDYQLLNAVHDAVAEQFGNDSTAARDIRGAFKTNGAPVLYRDVLITHEHGELGPVLAVRGQDFTGPSDVH